MQSIVLGTVAVYCVISLILAVRLLSMARRTGEFPELIMGLTFLVGGMIGYPSNVAAGFMLAASRPEAAHVFYVIGQVGMASAAFFLLIAWRKIFVPNLRGGRALVAGWGVLMAGALLYTLSITWSSVADERLTKVPYLCFLGMQAGCYGVMAAASFRHAKMLKRRCALGMADPVIANRLLLWGISNLSTTCSYIYSITAGILIANNLPNIYLPVTVSAFGALSAACITLGFLPPRAYVERIRASAAAGGV